MVKTMYHKFNDVMVRFIQSDDGSYEISVPDDDSMPTIASNKIPENYLGVKEGDFDEEADITG